LPTIFQQNKRNFLKKNSTFDTWITHIWSFLEPFF
jgi:hypothetical protein